MLNEVLSLDLQEMFLETFGGDLFSRSVTTQVSSALARFTSVFEMGTGGATPLDPPKDSAIIT